MPVVRRILSRILNHVFAAVLAMPYRDLSSGFRLYHSRVLRSAAHLAGRDFDAQEELLVRAYCEGWRIREVPIRYRPRHAGRSNARALRFAFSYLRTLRSLWALRNSASSCDYDSRAFDSWILPQRWWQRRRFRVITDLVRGEAHSVDVGCGASQIVQALPAMTGLDVNLRKLRFLRRKDPSRSLVCGSAFALPFRTGAFSTLVCSEVIEHVPKSRVLIAEMNRVLEAGGRLVLGTPDYSSRIWRIVEWCYGRLIPTGYEEEHISHYTGEEVRTLLPSVGFVIRSEHTIAASERIVHAEKVRDAWLEPRTASP
jgi:SAM-dependent methyltransferase